MANPKTPLLLATALLVAVVLAVRPGSNSKPTPTSSSLDSLRGQQDLSDVQPTLTQSPVDPSAGVRRSGAEALRADFMHLYDVSTSTHNGAPDDAFLRALPSFANAVYSLRSNDLLMPQRHRVGTIGAASLKQHALCDFRLDPAGIFISNDSTIQIGRIDACVSELRNRPPERASDIRGALHYAALSLQGDHPHVRGIIIVTDLEEFTPAGQLPASPDLSDICVAVYSLVTASAVQSPDSLALREERWRRHLRAWGARRVRVRNALGFNADDLTNFFHNCRK